MNNNDINLYDTSLELIEGEEAIQQRAKRGFSDYDICDFDHYLTNVIYFGLKQYLTNAKEIVDIPKDTVDKIISICYHLERAKEIQNNFDGANIEEVDEKMNTHNKLAFTALADILPTLWY